MRIFSIKGTKLVEIVEEQFPLEREVQRLTEANLKDLFDLTLVKSELELHGLRIDTLAFDKESGAFVIIEYKKDRNFSVVDQGVAYLNLMLNNKADFILEYNELFSSKPLKRKSIDWSQSRIIFIAPEFTIYQQYAIGFKDLGIQLWKVHKYSNGLVVLTEVKPPIVKESINTIIKGNPAARKISKEIKVYTEEDHLNRTADLNKELYLELKSKILAIGNDIEVRPKKKYGSKLKLILSIEKDQMTDPSNKDRLTKGVTEKPEKRVFLTDPKDIPDILRLIEQAYEAS